MRLLAPCKAGPRECICVSVFGGDRHLQSDNIDLSLCPHAPTAFCSGAPLTRLRRSSFCGMGATAVGAPPRSTHSRLSLIHAQQNPLSFMCQRCQCQRCQWNWCRLLLSRLSVPYCAGSGGRFLRVLTFSLALLACV